MRLATKKGVMRYLLRGELANNAGWMLLGQGGQLRGAGMLLRPACAAARCRPVANLWGGAAAGVSLLSQYGTLGPSARPAFLSVRRQKCMGLGRLHTQAAGQASALRPAECCRHVSCGTDPSLRGWAVLPIAFLPCNGCACCRSSAASTSVREMP
jgi:hypothetical protein